MFLLVWGETGIIGLLFLVCLIIYLFARAPRPLAFFYLDIPGAPAALIVLLALDHWPWSLHFGLLFFWFTLGLIKRQGCG